MENQTTTTRTALKWGIIGGIISIVFTVISKFFQNTIQPSIGLSISIFTGMAILASMILIYAMKDYKKQNSGFMSFGEGLGIGTLSGAIYGLLTGAFQLFYTKFIDDSELKTQINKMREQMENQNATESQIQTSESIISFMKNPNVLFILSVLISILIGFLFSLIIAAIIKKDKSVFE